MQFVSMNCQDDDLNAALSRSVQRISDPSGRTVSVIGDFDTLLLAGCYRCTPRQVHLAALDQNIWPKRYLRNHDSLSTGDQKRLLLARVAVIGAGGLGGYVLQLLARIGIGTLVAVDPDIFVETNLNRQAMADTGTLNACKTDVAAETLHRINPAIDVITRKTRFEHSNAGDILDGCHVAVDALDNLKDRAILQQACAGENIPFVHGALAGFEGRVMTVFPEDRSVQLFQDPGFGNEDAPAELHLGTPAIAPAFIASLQAMEVIKIVLNRGRAYQNRMIHADLENGYFEEYEF